MNLQTILNRLNIERLSPMQQEVLEAGRKGDDLILLSPTGTGKTLAFLLPLVESLQPDVEGVQAVVLVPSRELALQIEQVFKAMGTGFKVMSCYGGRPAMEEHRTMNSLHPDVIIGTPGRMNDHLGKQNFDAGTVRLLVIDEFDKSLELGFQEEMAEVIGALPRLRQRYLLSATDAEEIPRFTGVDRRTRKLNFLSEEEKPAAASLQVYCVPSPVKDKLETLYRLVCALGSEPTLVFCNYRESVDRVGKYLHSMKVYCETFHGGMEQEDRERALYKFRNGSCHIFISTDLAARGLDIPEIKNVVHYHLPVAEDGYIHRNGRTARWDADGKAYLILGPEEKMPEFVPADVETFVFPDPLPQPELPEFLTLYIGKGKKDKINKIDIVGFLSKRGGLNRDEIGRVDVKDHYAFAAISRKKARQVLALIRNEKIKGIKTLIEPAR
ncbi:DEAD/DEAH box helicase [uncultured Phocaeicola sp.]|uniref:DEAD/DEAH box helicase n=1 Tax=uncultured Phocaeicola sp. TaxID=990718 RepID=UPI0025E74EF4|nr:DEAD/DEAH box helicase [uncultured Phocaeicola sp.]